MSYSTFNILVVTLIVIVIVIAVFGVMRLREPAWSDGARDALRDLVERFGRPDEINKDVGGTAVWSSRKGLEKLCVTDRPYDVCCPVVLPGVVKAEMRVFVGHPMIATALMSVSPSIVYNQNTRSLQVVGATFGTVLLQLAYCASLLELTFDELMTKYKVSAKEPSSIRSEVDAGLQQLMSQWKNDMTSYKKSCDKLYDKVMAYQSRNNFAATTTCGPNKNCQNVFDYSRFQEAPYARSAVEGFTRNRVQVRDGEDEFVEAFRYDNRGLDTNARYATYRELYEAPRPQLPALVNTTLGSCKFNDQPSCYRTRDTPFACGDDIVGCSITPMYRVATTHELNSCAAPKTSYTMEPVSLSRPYDEFALGLKSYPPLSTQTYDQLTHSFYSSRMPTRTAK